MFVFLVLSILYPNGTLAGFAKATKTCPGQVVLEAIKFEEKSSCVKMTHSEYSLSSNFFFANK